MKIAMKNRTLIGIICIVAAILVVVVIAPLFNSFSTKTIKVIRLATDVVQGAQITSHNLEVAEVNAGSIPDNVINDSKRLIGKYAATSLHAGDYVYSDSISDSGTSATDIFAGLDGDKVAVSVAVSSFAAGLSNKLENADVISLIVSKRSATGDAKTYIPGALKYMRVITTTTSGGLDRDQLVEDEEGKITAYTTITFLCTKEQAILLADLISEGSSFTAILVYRPSLGSMEKAMEFWNEQDDWLLKYHDKLLEDFDSVQEEVILDNDEMTLNTTEG